MQRTQTEKHNGHMEMEKKPEKNDTVKNTKKRKYKLLKKKLQSEMDMKFYFATTKLNNGRIEKKKMHKKEPEKTK